MAGIPYVGIPQASGADLVTQAYVNSLLAANLTQATVDNLINTGLAPYVTKAYVDAQDNLNATKAFIDAGDATRLKLTQRNAANGAAGLDVNGRVDISRVAVASTQRWPKPFYSPSSYNASAINATTETQVFPAMTVADPGFTYKLLVLGTVDTSTSVDGEYSVVRVRQGSLSGQVVAGGYGLGEKYTGGVITQYNVAGTYTYTVPTWAGAIDVVALGGGGGGQDGFVFSFVSFFGNPGQHGVWATSTLTKGTTLPNGTSTLNITVGAGGAREGAGHASSVAGTGVTTVNAAGGGAGGSGTDGNAGTTVYNGQSYVGGAAAARGVVGNPPGGGGGGGTPAGSGPGRPGADGAVWLFAYPTPNTPSGPANLIPTALNAQTPITGATTLYVTAQRSGTASTQTVSTFNPGLFVVPIPA